MKADAAHLGYEVGTGKAVEVPVKHMVVAGITEHGKTTAMDCTTTAELGKFSGTFTSTGTVCYSKTYLKTVPDRDGIVRCPRCRRKMIKRHTNRVLTSNPPQYPWDWWCGGCDVYSAGGVDRGTTDEEGWRRAWQVENAPKAGK